MRRILLTTGGWTGDRYRSAVLAVQPQLKAYAAACGADFGLIDFPLDPDGKRGLFAQRLLIPRAFGKYDVVVHVDFDVLIPRNLPDIFSCVPAYAGLAAVVDPRGSPAYQKAWGYAAWTREGHQKSFEKLGLFSDKELSSINGGVVALRPSLISDLFERWYFDDSKYSGRETAYFGNNEETAMAYISQTNNLFAALDGRFNRQVLFALHETAQGRRAFAEYMSLPRRVMRKIVRSLGRPAHHVGFGPHYRLFVEDLLKGGNLVHFSGKYPIPTVNPDLLSGAD